MLYRTRNINVTGSSFALALFHRHMNYIIYTRMYVLISSQLQFI